MSRGEWARKLYALQPFYKYFESLGINFLKIALKCCAWPPTFFTAFSGEEVECQKMFLALKFSPEKSVKKLGTEHNS